MADFGRVKAGPWKKEPSQIFSEKLVLEKRKIATS